MVGNGSELPMTRNNNLDVGIESFETPKSPDIGNQMWNKYDSPLENENVEPTSETHKNSNFDLWANYDKPFDSIMLQNVEINSLQNNEVGDDNGKPYMRDGERIPNNEYDLNGYHYTTDEQGRIIKVEGTIQIPENKEPRKNLPDIKDSKETDDKGHLIAHEFGGADTEGNLVPMDSELNRHGDYRKCEREIGLASREGKEVNVTVECEYENDSRPTSFTVTIEIDGEVSERTFLNK